MERLIRFCLITGTQKISEFAYCHIIFLKQMINSEHTISFSFAKTCMTSPLGTTGSSLLVPSASASRTYAPSWDGPRTPSQRSCPCTEGKEESTTSSWSRWAKSAVSFGWTIPLRRNRQHQTREGHRTGNRCSVLGVGSEEAEAMPVHRSQGHTPPHHRVYMRMMKINVSSVASYYLKLKL